MICRFCGEEIHSEPMGKRLLSKRGPKCLGNPKTGLHLGITDGKNCVYCGHATETKSGYLYTKQGRDCPNSPTGMHCLQ